MLSLDMVISVQVPLPNAEASAFLPTFSYFHEPGDPAAAVLQAAVVEDQLSIRDVESRSAVQSPVNDLFRGE